MIRVRGAAVEGRCARCPRRQRPVPAVEQLSGQTRTPLGARQHTVPHPIENRYYLARDDSNQAVYFEVPLGGRFRSARRGMPVQADFDVLIGTQREVFLADERLKKLDESI